jgi:hypothetical protein
VPHSSASALAVPPAGFLISFALYGLAWLLRDHAEWRESRRITTTVDAE